MGTWLIGIEADLSWTNILGDTRCGAFGNCTTTNTWLSTARIRVGYVWDRITPYLTGGLAFGGVNAGNTLIGGLNEHTGVGYAIGAGLEFAINRVWSAKIEYLNVGLGKLDCATACNPNAPETIGFNFNLFRAGLNFHF
jgi:outer membrane immunogenic protein